MMNVEQRLIDRSGAAIVTDYVGELLTESIAATFDTSTTNKTVAASIDDSERSDLLGTNQIDIEFDLAGWYKPQSTPRGSTPSSPDRHDR